MCKYPSWWYRLGLVETSSRSWTRPRQQNKGQQQLGHCETDTILRARVEHEPSPLLGACRTHLGVLRPFWVPDTGMILVGNNGKPQDTQERLWDQGWEEGWLPCQQPRGWRRCSQAPHSSVWWEGGLEIAETWGEIQTDYKARNPPGTVWHWCWGPDKLLPSPVLEAIKPQLGKALRNLVLAQSCLCFGQGSTGDFLWSLPELHCYPLCGRKMCVCSLGSMWHIALFWDSNCSTQTYQECELLFRSTLNCGNAMLNALIK